MKNIRTSKQFYVYVLLRLNGVPFYVGKGTRDRIYDHDREARRGCVCPKCQVIREIWQESRSVQREVVYITIDEHDAFDAERQFIAIYGRDRLTNRTSGGQGQSGRIVSEETRAKMRATRRLITISGETREKMRATQIGRRFTPEHRSHLRTAHLGKKPTADVRARMVATHIGHSVSDETKAKLRAASTGKRRTEEARQKIGAARRGKTLSNETREKMRQSQLARHARRRTKNGT